MYFVKIFLSENLIMSDSSKISVEKIQSLWEEQERIHHIHLTLHDHIGCFYLSDEPHILSGVNIHQANCCNFPGKSRKKCLAHCRDKAMELAAKEKKIFTMSCWRGIKEAVMPLYYKDIHAATIFAGSFRVPDFDLSGFSRKYQEEYLSMPLWDDSRMAELETILMTTGYALLQLAENLRSNIEHEPGRKGIICNFLRQHFKEAVGVGDLAAHLELSESRTLHVLHELFGRGFSCLLNEERIHHVTEYLLNTELTLHEIARLTGFRNEYYLSSVFKKMRGRSPGELRRRAWNNRL